MFARLGLELLDDRNAPSPVAGNAVASADWLTTLESADWLPAYVGSYDGGTGAQSPANTPPVITGFSVVLLNASVARYSGTVSDESPGGLTVRLTGAQQCLGDGRTVTTNAEGFFQWDGPVRPTVDAGPAYADVSDAQGLNAERVDSTLDV